MISSEDSIKVKKLLVNLEFDLEDFSINKIGLGKNNRTYVVSTNKKKYLAKFYFSSSQDQRARLINEFSFLEYTKEIGIKNVPNPLIKSNENNLGIYEFIEGRPATSSDINKDRIISAAQFFYDVNKAEYANKGQQLNFASDAFIDLDKSIRQIDDKIFILESAIKKKDDKFEAVKYILDLKDVWSGLKSSLMVNKDLIVKNNSLCVSPSDFGFHNTLIKKDQLFFVDFEYAGRDDPAKFLADFFIQPEIKVSIEYMKLFADKALDYSDNKEIIYERAIKLFPMFQVKWCCIIMNEFLPETAKRRIFSNPELDIDASMQQQLQKAKQLLLDIK